MNTAAPHAVGTRPWHLGPPPSGGVDREVVTSDAVRLRLTVYPDGPRRVVLLHGLSQQRRFWDPVVRALHGGGLTVAAVDQRGHGDADKPESGYSMARCADDVAELVHQLGWRDAVVVGHSWGAAVALHAAAAHPDLVPAVVAIDGGLTGPADLGPRDQVRERLTPPRIAMPPAELLAMLRSGPLAPWWTPAVAAALAPTFETGPDGLARTRIGFERHMAILDGLLEHDPEQLLPRVGVPAWVVVCDAPGHASHAAARGLALDRARRLLRRPRAQLWADAIHDVPLQWPALVAGLVRAAVDEVTNATTTGGGR